MKVLIIKLSAFGDIIHALPALDDLLARNDVEEVHWLVDSRFAFVTEVFPESVHVHTVALKGKHPIKAAWQAVKTLRDEQFDVVIDLQGLIKSSLMAKLTGAKVYGFDPYYIREKQATWLQHHIPFHSDDRHIVQQCRRIATAPWCSDDKPDQAIPYIAPHIRQDLPHAALPDGIESIDAPWVILTLGGAWQTKQLPDNTWQHIANGIEKRGAHAIICWGNDEEHHKGLRIAQATNATLLPKRLDIIPLCSLLRRAASVIATDTGILHLAAALGTSTISFWGPSASWRSAPQGSQHQYIESNPDCGPCFKRNCADFICMDMIHAENILKKLDHHLPNAG